MYLYLINHEVVGSGEVVLGLSGAVGNTVGALVGVTQVGVAAVSSVAVVTEHQIMSTSIGSQVG